MATKSKKIKPEDTEQDLQVRITDAYIDFYLSQGKKPATVHAFTKKLRIDEKEFYQYFGSFEGLEKSIWSGFIKTTLETLDASEEYKSYPVKEKLLSFYYTLAEVLKNNRSFILASTAKETELLKNQTLSKARDVFKVYVTQLMAEGTESGEIVKRPYITEKYPEGLWLQLLFVLRFWIKDDSPDFGKTDAAIEKAVKLSFDLMGPGTVDSLIDLAKFLYQNK
ncbi:MAG: TetR/AcrR family transcriptional regulator [Bacteroidales bacterium]|nr:TetR/AcrR family transcriptional regulator [Bacteroidales bacterium]